MQEMWVHSLVWEDPWSGEGNGYPLQYSCLENSRDREAWQATGHGVTNESDMTERLNNNLSGQHQGCWFLLIEDIDAVGQALDSFELSNALLPFTVGRQTDVRVSLLGRPCPCLFMYEHKGVNCRMTPISKSISLSSGPEVVVGKGGHGGGLRALLFLTSGPSELAFECPGAKISQQKGRVLPLL